jgi:peroxiredoxin
MIRKALARASAVLLTTLCLAPGAGAVDTDTPAPDFTLPTLDGDAVRLEELRGEVVFINFWASWCGPCMQEMPLLDRIHQRYESAGLSLIGVNVEGDEAKARRVARKTGVSFPLLLDIQQAVSKEYGLKGMPVSVFVDKDGTIRHVHTGYKAGDEAAYVETIRALLRES